MYSLNILSSTYLKCKELSKECTDVEVMHEPLLACIPSRLSDFGMFPKSTITMLFQDEDSTPVRMTERVYKKDCKKLEYWRYLNLIRSKIRTIQFEYGYSLELVQTHDYFDFVHSKEDLLEWAINNIQLVRQ